MAKIGNFDFLQQNKHKTFAEILVPLILRFLTAWRMIGEMPDGRPAECPASRGATG
jgi:hypothetical protein